MHLRKKNVFKNFAKSRNSYFGNNLSVWFFLKFQNLSLKLKLPTERIRKRFEPKTVDEDVLVADAGLEGEGHDRQDRQGPAEDQQPHRRRTEEALIRGIRTCKKNRFLQNNLFIVLNSILFLNKYFYLL
jgi:hypothetical protein